MADETDPEGAIPAEEPRVVAPIESAPASHQGLISRVEGEFDKLKGDVKTEVATVESETPIAAILKGLNGALDSLDEAIQKHESVVAPVINEAALIEKDLSGKVSFTTGSKFGQELAGYVSRATSLVAKLEELTSKIEL